MTTEIRSSEASATAFDPPKPATQNKEHQWLKRFLGEWEAKGEVQMEPGQPPIKFEGTENTRAIGEFWIVADSKSACAPGELPYKSTLTLGFDPQKEKFVGTWIDSMSSYLWQYEGTLDETEKILTLETKGPLPTGEQANVREVTEFKNNNHRVFTSSFQRDDGEWSTMLTIDFRRK